MRNALWATTTQRERDGRRKTTRGCKGRSPLPLGEWGAVVDSGAKPHGGKYEIRTENEKILAEEVGRPIAEVARGRAYLSECAVYGKDFAKYSHCGFDPERKLWFTGSLNRNLYDLVELYGVNEATSEKAKALMKAKLDEVEEVIRKIKEG